MFRLPGPRARSMTLAQSEQVVPTIWPYWHGLVFAGFVFQATQPAIQSPIALKLETDSDVKSVLEPAATPWQYIRKYSPSEPFRTWPSGGLPAPVQTAASALPAQVLVEDGPIAVLVVELDITDKD